MRPRLKTAEQVRGAYVRSIEGLKAPVEAIATQIVSHATEQLFETASRGVNPYRSYRSQPEEPFAVLTVPTAELAVPDQRMQELLRHNKFEALLYEAVKEKVGQAGFRFGGLNRNALNFHVTLYAPAPLREELP